MNTSFLIDYYTFLDVKFIDPLRWEMAPALFLIIALLAYSAYADVFKDRTIPNSITLSLFCVSLAVVPFVFDDPVHHLLLALPAIVLVFIGWFIGGFAGGDVKLWVAMSILLGPAAFFYLMFSWTLIILYSIPEMIKTRKKAKEKNVQLDKFQRFGTKEGAPGIALAFPLVLCTYGLPLWAGGVIVAVGCSLVALYWLNNKLEQRFAPEDDQPLSKAEQLADDLERKLADDPATEQ